MRLRRFAGVVAMLSLGGATAAAAAGSGPTGSPKGIAVARSVHRAYANIGAETVAQTGFVSMYSVQGVHPQFSWMYGTGRVPKGWSRASEHVIAALRGGRLLWWRDDLKPPPCTSPGICTRIPVELVVDHAGAFYAFGSAAGHTCFSPLYGTVPVAVGALWYAVAGHYVAPVRHGGVIVLTHSFAWDSTQRATSIERVSPHTFLDFGGSLKVSRGGPGQPAFTTRYTNTQLAKAPKAPHVNLC